MKAYHTLNSILAVVLILTAPGAAADPLEWPIGQGGNGHYYELVADGLNWTQARDAAESRYWMGMQGHLATMGSHEEDYWCWQQFGVADHGYWLGGYQPDGATEPGEDWRWDTGERWSYTGWGSAEPNDLGGEDCLLGWFANFSGWNDGNCLGVTPWGYIVEYEFGVVDAEPTTWSRLKSAYK